MLNISNIIANELNITEKQVNSTITLLDEGGTVPFIARYRKEVTGSLDEEIIRQINERIEYLRNLEKRKEEVISSIEEQGKLTEELKKDILNATVLQRVEDLYLPYKKKKKTKADIAIENGLLPLSEIMLNEKITIAELEKIAIDYINENVENIQDAIEGAKLIIAQDLSENIEIKDYIRDLYKKYGVLYSKLVEKNRDLDSKLVYQDYYEYSEAVKQIPSHRVLAVNRGDKEKVLSISVKLDETNFDNLVKYVLSKYKNKNLCELYTNIIIDSLNRLILPSVERETRNLITERSEDDAIEIFKKYKKLTFTSSYLWEKYDWTRSGVSYRL